MYLELDGHGSLFEQLARALKLVVLQGVLRPGQRMPATRDLALELGVSRNTVLMAYEVLRAEGLVEARQGAGTFVTTVVTVERAPAPAPTELAPQSRYALRLRRVGEHPHSRARPRFKYDLQYFEPLLNPPLLTRWRSELAAAALRIELRYMPPRGVDALRAAISDYLARRRGVVSTSRDVLVVSGTQQALALTARVVLDDGDTVVVEDPGYHHADEVFRAHGAKVVPVRVDEEGLVVSALPKRSPRLIFVTPAHQFPGGSVMSLQRRSELLQYAATHDCWIFEDDYDSEFRFDARPIPSLRSMDLHDRVIYVGTFSKALLPFLRLGYMVPPAGLRGDFERAKRLADLGNPGIEQYAMAHFMQSGGFETHLRKAVAELRRRRKALHDGIARHCGDRLQVRNSQAGMHAVGWLPTMTFEQLEHLIQVAASRGLGLYSLVPYYRNRPPMPGLLLGYAGLSVTQINSATRLLAACMDEVEAGS